MTSAAMKKAFKAAQKQPFTKPPVCRRTFACHASLDRRDLVLSGVGASIALQHVVSGRASAKEVKYLQPNMLSTFQKKDQRAEIFKRTVDALSEVLTKADASKAMRLVFNDAATYDAATKTGGVNASIILSQEEARRPENADLSDYVNRLKAAKEKIDAGGQAIGQGPISWSDLIVMAVRVAVQKEWTDIKIARSADKSGGETIGKSFGALWEVQLGRIDSNEADPAGRIPGKDASVEEIRTFLLGLGTTGTPGPFSPKPPFWERQAFVIYPATTDDPQATEEKFAAENEMFASFKKKYDLSRKSVTRTDYEVDFINQFTKLSLLGAQFDPMAYLYAIPTITLS